MYRAWRIIRFKIQKLINIFLAANKKNKFKRIHSCRIGRKKKALSSSLASGYAHLQSWTKVLGTVMQYS